MAPLRGQLGRIIHSIALSLLFVTAMSQTEHIGFQMSKSTAPKSDRRCDTRVSGLSGG